MITLCRLAFMATLAAACIVSESFSSNLRGPVDDGWHTWQVETTRGELRIYTLMASGEPEEIHALRPHCGLTIDSQLTDLGIFAGDESIDWLEQFVSVSSDLSPAALHAIVQHAGDRPIAIIDKIL